MDRCDACILDTDWRILNMESVCDDCWEKFNHWLVEKNRLDEELITSWR